MLIIWKLVKNSRFSGWMVISAFDYSKKEVKLGSPFYPTGKIKEDVHYLQQFYLGATGRVPENGFKVNGWMRTMFFLIPVHANS